MAGYLLKDKGAGLTAGLKQYSKKFFWCKIKTAAEVRVLFSGKTKVSVQVLGLFLAKDVALRNYDIMSLNLYN